ncbi:MAG: ComF family protein [Prevotella sp.]|nr:ComF family protein [Prevotella sp.]MDY4217887.1 ComF family protein [Prevotella sp.]
MKPLISFLSRLIDLLAPRICVACNQRLSPTEDTLCGSCQLAIPRTTYHLSPFDNEVARLFWGKFPLEKATSCFLYHPGSPISHLVHQLKYNDRPDIGEAMGKIFAKELLSSGFFDSITALLPVPLAANRQRKRGYNQSEEIARGIQSVTRLPLLRKAVKRKPFKTSQTQQSYWGRMENVENDFCITQPAALENQHILLIDDVITTGATISTLGKEIAAIKGVKISILSLCYSKTL